MAILGVNKVVDRVYYHVFYKNYTKKPYLRANLYESVNLWVDSHEERH